MIDFLFFLIIHDLLLHCMNQLYLVNLCVKSYCSRLKRQDEKEVIDFEHLLETRICFFVYSY